MHSLVEHLAGAAARSLALSGEGLEAAGLAIRTAMARLGTGLPEQLLVADVGYRSPRVDFGAGHEAEFVSGPEPLPGSW